jgi:hypothetical protein
MNIELSPSDKSIFLQLADAQSAKKFEIDLIRYDQFITLVKTHIPFLKEEEIPLLVMIDDHFVEWQNQNPLISKVSKQFTTIILDFQANKGEGPVHQAWDSVTKFMNRCPSDHHIRYLILKGIHSIIGPCPHEMSQILDKAEIILDKLRLHFPDEIILLLRVVYHLYCNDQAKLNDFITIIESRTCSWSLLQTIDLMAGTPHSVRDILNKFEVHDSSKEIYVPSLLELLPITQRFASFDLIIPWFHKQKDHLSGLVDMLRDLSNTYSDGQILEILRKLLPYVSCLGVEQMRGFLSLIKARPFDRLSMELERALCLCQDLSSEDLITWCMLYHLFSERDEVSDECKNLVSILKYDVEKENRIPILQSLIMNFNHNPKGISDLTYALNLFTNEERVDVLKIYDLSKIGIKSNTGHAHFLTILHHNYEQKERTFECLRKLLEDQEVKVQEKIIKILAEVFNRNGVKFLNLVVEITRKFSYAQMSYPFLKSLAQIPSLKRIPIMEELDSSLLFFNRKDLRYFLFIYSRLAENQRVSQQSKIKGIFNAGPISGSRKLLNDLIYRVDSEYKDEQFASKVLELFSQILEMYSKEKMELIWLFNESTDMAIKYLTVVFPLIQNLPLINGIVSFLKIFQPIPAEQIPLFLNKLLARPESLTDLVSHIHQHHKSFPGDYLLPFAYLNSKDIPFKIAELFLTLSICDEVQQKQILTSLEKFPPEQMTCENVENAFKASGINFDEYLSVASFVSEFTSIIGCRLLGNMIFNIPLEGRKEKLLLAKQFMDDVNVDQFENIFNLMRMLSVDDFKVLASILKKLSDNSAWEEMNQLISILSLVNTHDQPKAIQFMDKIATHQESLLGVSDETMEKFPKLKNFLASILDRF